MNRLAASCALVVSLTWAAPPLDAGRSGSVAPRIAPGALEQAFPGRPGELIAVVLPAPKGPPVVPPVVPPVIPPPPIPDGRGRSEGDLDQPGPTPPQVAVIPEPGSMALLVVGASGLLGYGLLRRRRRS